MSSQDDIDLVYQGGEGAKSSPPPRDLTNSSYCPRDTRSYARVARRTPVKHLVRGPRCRT